MNVVSQPILTVQSAIARMKLESSKKKAYSFNYSGCPRWSGLDPAVQNNRGYRSCERRQEQPASFARPQARRMWSCSISTPTQFRRFSLFAYLLHCGFRQSRFAIFQQMSNLQREKYGLIFGTSLFSSRAFISEAKARANKWLQATFDPLRTLASARARIASNAPEPRR